MKHATWCEYFRSSRVLNRHDCICNCYPEVFNSPLVQSIRENHANIEKIASYEWEDMENQNAGDVF